MWPFQSKASSKPEIDKVRVDVRTVRNTSGMFQQIGKVGLGPGMRGEVNVAPGTVGAAMVHAGTLEIVPGYAGPMVDCMGGISSVVETAPVEDKAESGTGYMCPLCSYACSDPDVYLAHLATVHGYELIRYISDTMAVG